MCLKILAKNKPDFKISLFFGEFWPTYKGLVLVVHVMIYRIPFIPESLNRAVKPKRQRKDVEVLVLSLVRLIISKKVGRGTLDFKLNGHVVCSSTASYYSSNICVLLKYHRGHWFDYSVAVETTNVCISEIFTSFLCLRTCAIPSKWQSQKGQQHPYRNKILWAGNRADGIWRSNTFSIRRLEVTPDKDT